MHGLIFAELKKYVDQTLGVTAWDTLLAQAGLPGRIYMPVEQYPDSEAIALVTTASRVTGQPADAILQAFGEFIVPDLLRMYGSLVDKGWRTLDVVEHTEETIHRAVRLRDPGARPPRLRSERTAPSEVVIRYASERRMCGVAKGIVRGLAEHFAEAVEISEATCMHDGASECCISVRLVPSAPAS